MYKNFNPSNDNRKQSAKEKNMLIRFYKLLSLLATPLLKLYLYRRKNLGKEDKKRFPERLGYASMQRPEGKVIWFHCASVGESVSVYPLINKLAEANKDVHFLLTTGTVTSAKMAKTKLPENAFHQFVPADMPTGVKRFLKHWKPDLSIFVESELWPNLLTEAAKVNQVILINGRVSDNSFAKWSKYKATSAKLLQSFSFILAQSKIDQERFIKLGHDDVRYIGNLKFDTPALPADSQKMGELVNQIGERKVWLAASTHSNEEEMIGIIHKEIKEEHSDLLTIIVPRHINRMGEIAGEMKKLELNCSVRSKGDKIEKNTDIYIADTMGELGIFYRLVSLVFIGGSLVPRGGQNPLEAAKLDCSIIFAEHMFNFNEIRSQMIERKAAISLQGADELKITLQELIKDNEKQADLAKHAKDLVIEKEGITRDIIGFIQPLIKEEIKVDLNDDGQTETNVA